MNRTAAGLSLLICTLFIPCFLIAQKTNSIRGLLLSSDTGLSLNGIIVLNINTKRYAVTDKKGRFTIAYENTDTIEFRDDDWEIKRVIGSELRDSIFLNRRGIQIDEVIVTGNLLNAKLRDLQQMEFEQNRNGGIYYRGRPPLALLSPFGGKPLTFFYERFSKNGRRARKMSKRIGNEIQNENVAKMFNSELISSIIPLRGNDLDDFIQKYKPTSRQVENWTIYDAHIYIKKCFDSNNNENIKPD